MTPDELKQRTRQFAVAIIRFRRRLPATEESRAIGRPLIRAGTAVGAAYRAVCRCKSDRDFIAKLGTAIEEADETGYWLEVLVEAGEVPPTAARDLLREGDELTRIFVASRETIRQRVRAQKDREI